MFVLLEGTSGVGKSTVAEELCKISNFKLCPMPAAILSRRAEMHTADNSPQKLYEFYGMCVRLQSAQVGRLQETHCGHIVMARYWPSALAYHEALGVQVDRDDFGQLAEPDLIVHLYAHASSIKCRQQLSKKSNRLDPIYGHLDSDPDRMNSMLESVFKRWSTSQRRKIITTRRSPSQVRDEILGLLPLLKAA